MNEIEVEIIELAKEISRSKIHMSGSTKLYQDLGIAGDDMSELLMALQKKFGTSFQEMSFEKYYPNDLDAFIDHILRKVGLGSKWPPVTIGHLAQVVKSGSWFDP